MQFLSTLNHLQSLSTLRYTPYFFSHTPVVFASWLPLQVREYEADGLPAEVFNTLSTFRNNPSLGPLPGRDPNARGHATRKNEMKKKNKNAQQNVNITAPFKNTLNETLQEAPEPVLVTPDTVNFFDKENNVPGTPLRMKKRVKRRLVDAFREQVNSSNTNTSNLGSETANDPSDAPATDKVRVIKQNLDFTPRIPKRLAGTKRARNEATKKKKEADTAPPAAKRLCIRDATFGFFNLQLLSFFVSTPTKTPSPSRNIPSVESSTTTEAAGSVNNNTTFAEKLSAASDDIFDNFSGAESSAAMEIYEIDALDHVAQEQDVEMVSAEPEEVISEKKATPVIPRRSTRNQKFRKASTTKPAAAPKEDKKPKKVTKKTAKPAIKKTTTAPPAATIAKPNEDTWVGRLRPRRTAAAGVTN